MSGKMLAAAYTLICVATPVLGSADTPVAASVFKTFPDHASVCGAHPDHQRKLEIRNTSDLPPLL